MHVQEWWVTFELRSYGPWRLPTFLFVLLYPVVLFILARLLFPFGFSEGIVDLEKFYFENYRRIFLFVAILALLSILDNLLLRKYFIEDIIAPGIVMILLSLTAIARLSNPWLHKGVAIFLLLSMIISIAIEWDRWLVAS